MRDNDGWKLSKAAREQLRITAVKRILAEESPEEVIKSIGSNRRCIYQWLSAYRSGRFEALLKIIKITVDVPPILSWVQMFHLYKIITGENPLQYQARVCAVDYRNSPPIDSPRVWDKTLIRKISSSISLRNHLCNMSCVFRYEKISNFPLVTCLV
jgi:hypothetical protein